MQTLRQFMLRVGRLLNRALLAIAVAAVGAVFWASPGVTQTSSSSSGLGQMIQNVLSGQPIQQVLQSGVSGSGTPTSPQVTIAPSVTPQTTTIPVAGTPAAGQSMTPGMTTIPVATTGMTMPPATPSGPPQTHLEKIMSDRAGVPLSLFGYDEVGSGAPASVPSIGAIPDNYILGPGDQIDVSTRGQGSTSNDYRVTVDRDGHSAISAATCSRPSARPSSAPTPS
jgi:hypothetical protein